MEFNLAEQVVFHRFVDSINSGSVDFLLCAPLGSSSWVSSFRDVTGRGRCGRIGIQQVRMGTLLALRGATACAAAQERGIPWIVEQFQPRAGELAFFGFRRVDRSFANAGVQSFSICHHLRPHADRQFIRMASNFVLLLLQHSLDALTSSEFCQALIEGILNAHAWRPRAPVANVTEPIWSRVGQQRACAPALFETRPRLNQLAPLRPITVTS